MVKISKTVTIQLYRGEGKSCETQLIYVTKTESAQRNGCPYHESGKKTQRLRRDKFFSPRISLPFGSQGD